MRAVVTTEQHFVRTPGGVFVQGDEDYAFFERYLSAFDGVVVAARVDRATQAGESARRVDGPGVELADLPEFRGFRGYVRNGPRALGILSRLAARPNDAFILRAPGGVAGLAWLACRRYRRPFGVEVVADPAQSFSARTFGSGATLLRLPAVEMLRAELRTCSAAAYVTSEALQRLYPAPAPSFSYSSIDIGDELFSSATSVHARICSQEERLASPRLVFVGRLQRPFKGLDVLIEALGLVVAAGFNPTLDVIGGGACVEAARQQAKELGVLAAIHFHGEITSRQRLVGLLTAADLFVLPSRREGLPRALIEAMAVGLPAIATNVGGTAELLSCDDLVAVEDADGLAKRILFFARSRSARLVASTRNAEVARRFHRDRLSRERLRFYAAVKDAAGLSSSADTTGARTMSKPSEEHAP